MLDQTNEKKKEECIVFVCNIAMNTKAGTIAQIAAMK